MMCCLPASLRRKLWCGIPFDEVKMDDEGIYIDNDEDDLVMSNIMLNFTFVNKTGK